MKFPKKLVAIASFQMSALIHANQIGITYQFLNSGSSAHTPYVF